MSTQSFLVLFFLAAVVVLTAPAIASDHPLRHKGCKPPKTGSPSPSPQDEFILDEEDIDDNKGCPPPGPENEAIDPLHRKPCKPPKTGSPSPSPVGEFMMEAEEEEEDAHENKGCKPPKAPVPSPKEQIDHIRPPGPENQSHQLRHRKVPPSPAPSPAEE